MVPLAVRIAALALAVLLVACQQNSGVRVNTDAPLTSSTQAVPSSSAETSPTVATEIAESTGSAVEPIRVPSGFVAITPSGPPADPVEPEVACTTSEQCRFDNHEFAADDSCCAGCGMRALNVQAWSKVVARCQKKPRARCPKYKCAYPGEATCLRGRCVGRFGLPEASFMTVWSGLAQERSLPPLRFSIPVTPGTEFFRFAGPGNYFVGHSLEGDLIRADRLPPGQQPAQWLARQLHPSHDAPAFVGPAVEVDVLGTRRSGRPYVSGAGARSRVGCALSIPAGADTVVFLVAKHLANVPENACERLIGSLAFGDDPRNLVLGAPD